MSICWINKKEELEDYIFTQNLSYDKIGEKYNCSGTAVRKAAVRLGIKLPRKRRINPKETFNKGTGLKGVCKNCGNPMIMYTPNRLFCCRECYNQYRESRHIERWKEGKVPGTVGYNCSSPVRKYLFKKHGNSCQICGWGETNPFTGRIPLQVHHINGDSLDNNEENLMLLCPNCHSLTENFGSRNKNSPRGKSIYYGKNKVS